VIVDITNILAERKLGREKVKLLRCACQGEIREPSDWWAVVDTEAKDAPVIKLICAHCGKSHMVGAATPVEDDER